MNFESICRKAAKSFEWMVGDIEKFKEKANKSVSQEFIDSLTFTGMTLEPYQILLFSYGSAVIAFLFSLFIDALILFFYHFSIASSYFAILIMILTTLLFPLLALQIVSEYPKYKAKQMKIHSLGDIPEVLSYIVMYLKLNPNLENAFRFAARESNTSLAKDLRKLLWDMEIRIHKSIDDAITYFANLWGKWSDYLKRALHLIRSAVHEKSNERNTTLDRSIDVVLEGTKSMMMDFSQKLHQPTLVIYSMGVMIPLALVAMFPALSLIKTKFKIGIMEIFVFYDILLPLVLLFYIRKILAARPATFPLAPIPHSHPELRNLNKKKNAVIALIAAFIVSFIGLIFLKFFPSSIFPSSLIALWAFATFFSTYSLTTYSPYKRIRDEIKEMENEFGDALYVLGKRIMEGKPAEEAFIYASHALEGSKIAKVFERTSYNLLSMRMNTRAALFDEKFGSLKHVYSSRIRAIMKLLAEGIKKSYVAAGVAIVKIADHLKQLQNVEKSIKNALGTLTSTLRTTANIFAPIIAGVTLGITKLISSTLLGMPSSSAFAAANFVNIKPNYFVFVIGVYIIELIFLLNRLANGIDEGDDRIEYMYDIGKYLPTSVILFTIVTILSILFFQSMSP
ncbi:MAG: hypothetical protein FE045_03200 [Thermoplasmata archaeon]|nr:MAG: hypothetical protein FE045_03200 [Thermoplasmata archaeon]